MHNQCNRRKATIVITKLLLLLLSGIGLASVRACLLPANQSIYTVNIEEDYDLELLNETRGQLVDHYATLEGRYLGSVYTANYMRFFEFIGIYEYNSGDPQLDEYNLYASGQPVADDADCRRDLKTIIDLFDRYSVDSQSNLSAQDSHIEPKWKFQLANYLDSFGKPDNGILYGNNMFLGAYSQCINSRIDAISQEDEIEQKTRATNEIKMRYCMGNAKLDVWSEMRLPCNFNRTNEPYINVALCLPETCDTRLGNNYLKELNRLMLHNIPEAFFHRRLHLDNIYCLPDERSPLRKFDWTFYVFVTFIALWAAIMLLSNYLYERQRKTEKYTLDNGSTAANALFLSDGKLIQQLFKALSIRRAINNLFPQQQQKQKQSVKRVNFDIFNIIKVSVMLVEVALHYLWFSTVITKDRLDTFRRVDSDSVTLSLMFYLTAVDAFLLISSTLISYTNLKKWTKSTTSSNLNKCLCSSTSPDIQLEPISGCLECGHCATNKSNANTVIKAMPLKDVARLSVKFSIRRYARFLPLYIFVLWFVKYLYVFAASGPLWDYGTSEALMSLECKQETWWTMFSSLLNNKSINKQCIIPFWTSSIDLQFSLVAIPLVYFLARARKAALAIYVVVIAMATHFQYVFYDNLAGSLKETSTVRMSSATRVFKYATYAYYMPQYRLNILIGGLILGYILYLYDERVIEQWPKWMINFNKIAIYLYPALHLFTLYISSIDGPNGLLGPWLKLFVNFCFTHFRTVLLVVYGSVLMEMCTTKLKKWTFIRRPFWTTLAKLNYGVSLFNWHFTLYLLMSTEQILAFSWPIMASQVLFIYVGCALFASLIYILFEYPMIELCNLILATPLLVTAVDKESIEQEERDITRKNTHQNHLFNREPLNGKASQ